MSGPLFKPFRALGYITEDVPFAVQRRGKETYAVVSVGRTWQIYNTSKLTLVMVGPQLPRAVVALATKGDLTFAATGAAIHEAKRMHATGVYAGHRAAVLQMLVLGDNLLSLGKDRQLLVWKIGQYDAPEAVIDLGADFEPSCMAHPDTYINKVVIGGTDGSLQMWNFKTQQLVHSFKSWGSPVRCLAASPALDVMAVGLADGRAILHNLRYDEQVMVLHNAAAAGTGAARFLQGTAAANAAAASSAAVTCLSFRTGQGLPLLAVGGSAGLIALWNLEGRCLHHVIRDAHDRPLLGLHFFAGEPLLMSSAGDNSIKQWVLDGTDAVPRLLKFRSGHSAPPAVVRHYAEGLRLLSAGADRSFRLFSTIQDQQSRELSQKHTAARAKKLKVSAEELKLPRVTQMAACETRERDWANVVTCHAGDPAAYTWRLAHFTLGEHVLLPPPEEQQAPGQQLQTAAAATAVAVSCCGNFALVGNDAGRVDRYNLQSGIHRGSYWRKQADGALLPAHESTVVGLGSDSCNKLLVTVGSDAALRTWDFRKQSLAGELLLGAAATHLALHTGSDLAAVGCVDRVVRLVDIEACRVVRRFSGHSDRLTDVAISADCRWLLTAGMDCTLRVWDIPASQCLQVMHMGTPVTSLTLSGSQDLLATAHVNKRGVFLWSSQLMFGDPAAVATYSEDAIPVHLPTIAAANAGKQQQGGKKQQQQRQQDKVRVASARAGKQQQKGGDDGSSSEEDGQQSEQEDEQEATQMLQGREVRLLVDGGVFSDAEEESSSDYYHSDGSSSSSDSEADAAGDSSSDEPGNSGSEDELQQQKQRKKKRSRARRAAEAAAAAAAAVAAAAYRQTDSSGAPAPLGPNLATLSLLPRSQWENLLHLDTIKARSKPLAPPKKPEAAPFFLPTVPGLSRNPVFAAADGAEVEGAEEGEAGPGSRVLRSRGDSVSAAAAPSAFVALLRSSSAAGDFASFISHIRGLSPAALDLELRATLVLEGDESAAADESAEEENEDVKDVGLLLEALQGELDAARNFEMVQALLARVLVIHGDTLMRHASLLSAVQRLQRRLRGTWLRLDELLQNVRCMVDFIGNAQQ
uniref:Small-subunit processome Utp21 domain-containing protein n=1 Tax=Tetradesmus obliquus TaxID=3088 RepID=A0A383VCR0_TETOB